jgi:hypothetical protein
VRRLPTASQLDRVFNCAASEVLPHIRSMSARAERGTGVHAFIPRARAIGREEALAEIDEDASHRALCEALPLDELPVGGDHEVALAWDHVTDRGRILPAAGQRDYAAAVPTEFVGTADHMGRTDFEVIVLDWKSGHRYLGPAARSRQLRMLALAAARALGVEQARVAYFYLRDDGTYGTSWAEFDAFDLAEIADELRGLAETLPQATSADVSEGPHCDFCPAFNSCPAKMKLALAIGSGDAQRELASIERRVEAMTDGELARAYETLERYDDIAERVRRTIRQRAAMHPIDLGDGRELSTVQWPFTAVKADIAYATVRELHGEAAAEQVAPRSATVTAIRKLGKDTLAEIERRRGVVTGSKPQVRIHRR